MQTSDGGLVVEYSPATRVTRVRFPADAVIIFSNNLIIEEIFRFKKLTKNFDHVI